MSKEKIYSAPSYTTKTMYCDHSIYLLGSIGEAEQYVDAFNILRSAKAEDTVKIYINSGGGMYWTAVQFINAIKQSDALVTTQIDGVAHSAASIIFLAADSWIIPSTSSMLCHYITSGYSGKMHEIDQWHTHTDAHFKQLTHDYYKAFMTEKEIEQMIDGKDFWFGGSEIKTRIQKLAKYRDKKIKEEQEKEKENQK